MPTQDNEARSDAQPKSAREAMLAIIRDDDGSTTTCQCGAPAVCVGQFEGEPAPMVACDECCNHEDFNECGRCWPLAAEVSS